MKKVLLSLIVLCSITVSAQRTCLTDTKMAALKSDPAFQAHHNEIMEFVRNPENYQTRLNDANSPTTVVTIPVVFHVLWKNATQNISDAQINSQLAILNADFRKLNIDFSSVVPAVFQPFGADLEINFVMAPATPAGLPTNGITRKQVPFSFVFEDEYYTAAGELAWSPMSYLNIWVGRFTDTSLLGFAYLPSAAGAPYDGLCIGDQYLGNTGTATYPFNKGRTATHEIGHYFGLEHPWGDECSYNDGVADTPATDYPYFNCPSFPNNANACTVTTNGSMFMNYMDYVNDACMAFFTNGQKAVVQNTLNGPRANLLSVPTTAGAQTVAIYPNPATDYFIISGQSGVDMVEVYNTNGQLLKSQKLTENNEKVFISELQSGVYFLRIYNQGKLLKSDKIVKN